MRIVEEFKEFAVKGNAMDLAVGIVIGAAFQKIVNSLVNDIIMPPISAVMGKVDLSNYFVNLSDTEVSTIAEAREKALPTINYGMFINNVIEFLIVAVSLFLIVKVLNRLRRQQEKEAKKEQKALVKQAVQETKK